jgi:hypothetical protein
LPARLSGRATLISAWPRLGARARQAGLGLATVAGLGLFAWIANSHYPLGQWLFFYYARIWLFGLVFLGASLAAGLRLLDGLLPEPAPLGERAIVALSLGVLVFITGIFVLGAVGCLGTVAFFAWPAALLLAGGRPVAASVRRAWRRLRPFGFRLFQPRGAIEGAAAALLVLALCAVYLQVITPTNVGADAHWYHLPIAEHYAAAGRIRPFAEGWMLGSLPQLASLIYTWAFLSPGTLFDHVALCSHLEWFLFLATLAGVASLARRLLGGTRVPLAAAAMFTFPGLLLYDSSLLTMADHVLAFWGPPMALALLRLRRWFAPREAVVAALITSGAALTKYQSIYLVAPSILALSVWTIQKRRLAPVAAYALTGIVATSSHWLKNTFFYGDPFYPFLASLFPAHPLREGGSSLVDAAGMSSLGGLDGTLGFKIGETLKALGTFSLFPHDWPALHGDRPVFGSLFTLLLPVLLFVRAPRQLWLSVIGAHIGIALWFATCHQDRYLQAMVPWMAACTAALLVLAWRNGRLPVRAAVAALVAFQLVWGADVYFMRTHVMIGDSPLKRTVDYLAAGSQKLYKERFRIWGDVQDVGKAVPKGAKVLLHEMQEKLGIGAEAVADAAQWQLGLDYLASSSPQDTLALWKRMGITHLVWRPDRNAASAEWLAREAVFVHALELYGADTKVIGPYRLTGVAALPTRPGADVATRIAWLGCGRDPPPGIYTPHGLAKGQPLETISLAMLANQPEAALSTAQIAILRPSCAELKAASAVIGGPFRKVIRAVDNELWIRKP